MNKNRLENLISVKSFARENSIDKKFNCEASSVNTISNLSETSLGIHDHINHLNQAFMKYERIKKNIFF